VAKDKTQSLDIEKIIKKAVESAVSVAYKAGYDARKQEIKNYFKQTEKRLYAYPELKENIEKYKLDIEDLKREKVSCRSKDIVRIPEGSGIRLSPEEIQEARIQNVVKKMERDQLEIDEINYALDAVRNDEYYKVIEYKYFQGMTNDDEIGELLHCDGRTVRRHKNRLVNKIAVKLYGADAND
jgi:nicotinamide mononucleotide adenylyltransferase